MKFAAVLRDSSAELPDTADLFRKYKQLKKSLKRIPAAPDANQDRDSHLDGASPSSSDAEDKKTARSTGPSQANDTSNNHNSDDAKPFLLDPAMEVEFLRAISSDVMELNERYIEKEEDNVITFGNLEEAAAAAANSPDSKAAVHRAFVNFHGELLMLLHWSILAYTGLVKILKKHRKRTGAPLHAPHLENMLSQPFCSVEVTCDMIRRAEKYVAELAETLDVPPLQPAQLNDLLIAGASETLTSPASKAAAAVLVKATGAAAANDNSDDEKCGNTTTNRGTKRTIAGTPIPVPHASAPLHSIGTAKIPPGVGAAASAASPTIEVKMGVDERPQQFAEDNQATRRVKAALHVWKQLQSNVSTPSTGIAPGSNGGVPPRVEPSTMTNSSVA